MAILLQKAIPFRDSWRIALVVIACVLVQWPLIANPGYFSHDELQWASFAGSAGPIPWVSWTRVDTFQYRPLTFNIWLWLSRICFEEPKAFHFILVLWGAINSASLYSLMRKFGIQFASAAIGALVFTLSPYAIFVHGWVGTIGDLLWVSAALGLGLTTIYLSQYQTAGSPKNYSARLSMRLGLTAFASVVFTMLGLLAKEAAVVIPAMLLLAWWFDSRKRFWRVATLASSFVVGIYLVLRVGTLLNTPSVGAYSLSAANVPKRWLEYQLFGFMPYVFETFNVFAAGINRQVLFAGVLWVALIIVLWRSGLRVVAVFLLAGFAVLAPVLPLAASSNQYGYGFAAVTTATAAAAWRNSQPWGRSVLLLVALVFVWHGIFVMRTMRHVGEVQAVFSPSLANALQACGDQPLRLRTPSTSESWIFERLTHEIPSYRGVPIGQRVQLVGADMPADATIASNGSLVCLRNEPIKIP